MTILLLQFHLLSFSTIAPANRLLSLDLSRTLQLLSSFSSAGEELQCCAVPENVCKMYAFQL